MPLDPRVARSVETAVACGAPPAMVLTVALAALHPSSIEQAIAILVDNASELRELGAAGTRVPSALAVLEPELRFEVEIAKVLPGTGDHELRGRRLFRDILGHKTFFQVAALAIGGIDLSAADSELLEHQGVITQLADPGIWPLTVTRRVGFRGDLGHAVLAGLATLLNPNMSVTPVRDFMLVLGKMANASDAGRSVAQQLDEVVARRERLPGVGRPALGPDERNAQTVAYVQRFGRDQGANWKMALEIDAYFAKKKGLRINGAGLQGALLRDIGFSPSAGMALCTLYFMVPVLAQAVFAVEQAKNGGHP